MESRGKAIPSIPKIGHPDSRTNNAEPVEPTLNDSDARINQWLVLAVSVAFKFKRFAMSFQIPREDSVSEIRIVDGSRRAARGIQLYTTGVLSHTHTPVDDLCVAANMDRRCDDSTFGQPHSGT